MSDLQDSSVAITSRTGSTNITAGAIFGHSNVGHVVRQRKSQGNDEEDMGLVLIWWELMLMYLSKVPRALGKATLKRRIGFTDSILFCRLWGIGRLPKIIFQWKSGASGASCFQRERHPAAQPGQRLVNLEIERRVFCIPIINWNGILLQSFVLLSWLRGPTPELVIAYLSRRIIGRGSFSFPRGFARALVQNLWKSFIIVHHFIFSIVGSLKPSIVIKIINFSFWSPL